MPRSTDTSERIRTSVVVDENGCWRWQLYRHVKEGYGIASYQGRRVMAHRLAYETFVGPIPAGHSIDHLCRVRDCVNPEHLEPVTSQVNTLRSPITRASLNAAKTSCPTGHPYDQANTYTYRGARICRACQAAATARYRARRQTTKAS